MQINAGYMYVIYSSKPVDEKCQSPRNKRLINVLIHYIMPRNIYGLYYRHIDCSRLNANDWLIILSSIHV